jgi:putative nucleotidyltransferase with HDIG domain
LSNLLRDIIEHLLNDAKPSIYLNNIKETLKDTPLQILLELEGVEQEKKYHPEGNVLSHILLVVDRAAGIRNYANNPESLMLAALLHDVGKKAATRKNRSGRWISYDHDKIGAELVRKILTTYNIREEQIDKVCTLVRYHMHHLFIIKNLPYGNVESLVKEVDINDMALLFISDRLGRLQETYDEKSKEIFDVLEILDILNKKYNVDISEAKGNVEKILKNLNNS